MKEKNYENAEVFSSFMFKTHRLLVYCNFRHLSDSKQYCSFGKIYIFLTLALDWIRKTGRILAYLNVPFWHIYRETHKSTPQTTHTHTYTCLILAPRMSSTYTLYWVYLLLQLEYSCNTNKNNRPISPPTKREQCSHTFWAPAPPPPSPHRTQTNGLNVARGYK